MVEFEIRRLVQFEIRRLVQFEIRRRRWLTSAQRWSASDNPGFARQPELNPVRVRQSPTLSGFTVYFECTQGCRWRSNAGLKLANAFGVFQTEPVGVFQTQPPPGGDLPTVLTKSFVSDESPGTFKI